MSHMSQVRICVASVATAALLLPLAPASARSPVHCGQVIKQDTTLKANLLNCPGRGLTIGANGVTLNLAGHRIDGTNARGSEGIVVDGHSHVTIRNGRVAQFRVNGVAIRKSPHARVMHLKVAGIGAGGKEGQPVSAGIFVQGSSDAQLRLNRVSNAVKAFQADGIVVLDSKRPHVVGNSASANAWNGIVVVNSPTAEIRRNRTDHNTNSGIFAANDSNATIADNDANGQKNPDTAGIAVLAAKHATVSGNRATGNGGSGIALESGTTAAKVTGNTVKGGGDGIALLECDSNTVKGNHVTGVGGVGIYLDAFGPDDATKTGSDDNTIAQNRVKSSGLAGIAIFGGSDGNRLTGNVSDGSRGDGSNDDPSSGILIDGSTGNKLEGNTTSKNTADGVHITAAGNTVASTTALDNLRRGIDAVAGTIDGGGNHASGNGLEPQCTGVACG
jgi:parallel beta-helix repeat protein